MILSELMYAELKFIDRHVIFLSETRILHQSTLKALLNRKLIYRDGSQITTTSLGHEIANHAKLNKRKFEADVSKSVKDLLRVGKILSIKSNMRRRNIA